MTDETWKTIEQLRQWLDEKDNATPEQARLLRLLKIQEEVGEVAQAAMGAVAANPRKGRSHMWTDVENELCDVILSSMVALATLTPDAAGVFQKRVDIIAERSLAPQGSA
ncbi:MazG-like family protein [Streptomyces polygonati]|uniref:MazG-like family protein n=1 Tax=Streptomyces polygonati TaxID=1617087 RepID=A0ABV8HUM3_9ACTN